MNYTQEQLDELTKQLNPVTLPGEWDAPGIHTSCDRKYVCSRRDGCSRNGYIDSGTYDTPEEAVAAWNAMFPVESDLQKEIGLLRGDLSNWADFGRYIQTTVGMHAEPFLPGEFTDRLENLVRQNQIPDGYEQMDDDDFGAILINGKVVDGEIECPVMERPYFKWATALGIEMLDVTTINDLGIIKLKKVNK
jgi:hypothetical protein